MQPAKQSIEARAHAAIASPHALRFRSAGDMMACTAPTTWCIRDVIECDTLATMVGEPGTFKSFLALDWSASLATGTDWEGHRVERCPVLYVAGEGHGGIGRRLKAWSIANRISLDDAQLYVSSRAAALNCNDGFQSVVAAVDELGDVRPGLIVVDTLARNYQGDENSATDMGAFVAAVDELRRPFGASVLIVHHCGVGATDRGRGSTALHGAVDWQWMVSREPGCSVFRCTKSKDSEPPTPFAMRIETVDIGLVDPVDGRPITSAVLRLADLPTPREKGAGGNQVRAMSALRKLYAQARTNLTKQGRDPDDALVDLARWKEAADLDRKRFSEVKTALADRGLILIEHPHVRLADAA